MSFLKYPIQVVFIFIIAFHSNEASFADINSIMEKEALPPNVCRELRTYIEIFNKNKGPVDGLEPYDPRIVEIPEKGYHFENGKYFIPISKSGSNVTFTLFLLWDNGIHECFTTYGFDLILLEKIKDFPFLKAYYNAGCCDSRYYAVGVISLSHTVPENLFILPVFAKNKRDNLSIPYVYCDIDFELFSSLSVVRSTEKGNYQFNVDVWAFDQSYIPTLEEYSLNTFSGIKNSPADLSFRINYGEKGREMYISESDREKIPSLTKLGWPDKQIDFQNLIKSFIKWIRENPRVLKE
jgi:hypothetical protein